MLFIAAFTAIWLALVAGPRLIACAIALPLGIILALECRRTGEAIAALAKNGKSGSIDGKTDRARRRALDAGLRDAIRQTMFMSLLPTVAIRSTGIVERIVR